MRPEHIAHLKGGKAYPTYPGVLDAATEAGLTSLTIEVLQFPNAENGQTAVVLARAEFADGRVFMDVGDCSPASCSPQIAIHSLRMASTRAKGRALRDALNIGEALLEEMGEHGPIDAAPGAALTPRLPPAGHPEPTPRVQTSQGPAFARHEPGTEAGRPLVASPAPRPPPVCKHEGCGDRLTDEEYEIARIKAAAKLLSGGPYCTIHLADHLKPPAP